MGQGHLGLGHLCGRGESSQLTSSLGRAEISLTEGKEMEPKWKL